MIIGGIVKVRIFSVLDVRASDPFCKLGLVDKDDAWVGQCGTTTVKCSTHYPSWGEDALFDFKFGSTGDATHLKIEVWDKGSAGTDVFVGNLLVKLEDISQQKHTTTYTPQLVVAPNLALNTSKNTILHFSCSFFPDGSTLAEDEWMLPRHERLAGKGLVRRAEALVLEKSKKILESDRNAGYSETLRGKLMERLQSRLVRVFVSSTFTDTEKERNFLMTDVYPFMQHLCKVLGMEFETVDMRWGVRQETTLSHNTSALCMSEIEKCVKRCFGPAFLCLLGDKYGYRPFPAQITKPTLDKMWQILCAERLAESKKNPTSRALVSAYVPEMAKRGIEGTRQWKGINWKSLTPLSYIPICFRLDLNMKEPHYVLKSRYDVGLADDKLWWPIFEELQKLLRRASKVMVKEAKGAGKEELQKFEISVTEEEVLNGILHNELRADQSTCVLRTITDVESLAGNVRGKYIDVAGPDIDSDAVRLLGQLKDRVRQKLGPADNTLEISISSNELDPTAVQSDAGIKYRKELNDTICARLTGKLLTQFETQAKIASPLYDEVVRQLTFRAEKLEIYVERPDVQQKLVNYLTTEGDSQVQTFVLQAQSGAGKTALLAWASHWATENIPDAIVITRFLGTSPQSADVLSLLQSVCSQLIEVMKIEGIRPEKEAYTTRDKSAMQLASMLVMLMNEFGAKRKKLVFVLDSLDQLLPAYGAHLLYWLPSVLPPHVRMIVSVLISSTPSTDTSLNLIERLRTLTKGTLNDCTIEAMDIGAAEEVLRQILASKQRTLVEAQKNVVISGYKTSPTPLYLQAASIFALGWNSYTPIEECILEQGMRGIINQVFVKLEKKHGELLIGRALAYLVESRHGLSSAEMEDVLSCDEIVLSDIFEWWTPPVRRLPPLLWKRVREDLGRFIVDRGVHGVTVHNLYHRQFREAAKARYADTPEREKQIAQHLARFFDGDFSTPQLVPFVNKKAGGVVQAEDRLIAPQALRHARAQFNRRKLSELPYLQAKSGNFESLNSSLFNFEFIEAKAEAGMLDELDEDYETALKAIALANSYANSSANTNLEALLKEFSQFIRRKRHVIRVSPKDTLMHALNEPSSLTIPKMAYDQWKKNPSHSQKVIFRHINKPHVQDPCVMTFTGHLSLACCSLTPDKSILVSGAFDLTTQTNTLKLWNMKTGQELFTLAGHTNSIDSCLVTPDGSKIVSVSIDGTIRIWDALTGHQIYVLNSGSRVCACAITNDNKLICGEQKGAQMWDLDSRELIKSFNSEKSVKECSVSPDSKLVLLAGYMHIVILEISSWQVLFQAPRTSSGNAWVPDGRLIFTDGANLKIWDRESNQATNFITHSNNVTALAFHENLVFSAIERVLVICDFSTKQQICTIRGHSASIDNMLAYDKKILTTSRDSTIRVWDLDLALKQQVSVHHGKVILCNIRKRRDKILAVMCAENQNFKAWNLATGELVCEFYDIYGFRPEVSPDAEKLAAISDDDKEVMIWDMASETELLSLVHDKEIMSFRYSPDGTKIVTYWGYEPCVISIWDVASGKQLKSFDAEEKVNVEFLDDNKLISVYMNYQCGEGIPSIVNIIDIASLQVLRSYEFFMADFYLATQVEGNIVVMASDIHVKAWDISTDQVIYEKFIAHENRVPFNHTVALTGDTMWIAEIGGEVQKVEKKAGVWEVGEKCMVVAGEIVGIYGKENKFVVCCASGEVFFFDVTNN